jgi:type IV pilus assembly protein PilQ
MKNHLKSLAGLALCALLAPATPLAEPPRAGASNVIQGIGVSDAAGGVELEIRGTRAPSYTVFKLQDPPRLVVDLAGADVSALSAPVAVGKGGVREVTTAQYQDERSAVGRVIVALDAGARYEVRPRDRAVVVKVAAADGRPLDAEKKVATAAPSQPLSPALSPAGGEGAGPAAIAEHRQRDHVLSRRADEAAVSRPATTVLGARARQGAVALALDGEVSRFDVLELEDPPRLAVDLYGISKAPRSAVTLDGAFKQARFGRDLGKVRVVLDAAGELPRCEVRRTAGGLLIAPAAVAWQLPARTLKVAAETAPQLSADCKAGACPPPPAAEPVKAVTAQSQAAGFTSTAPAYALSGAPQKREYTGRRITLDFHDIEIRNLLRLIADVSKKNIVVADDVSGKVTVALRNVPWDQALDLVLKTKGLDKEEMGNVIRVAKIEEIAKEQTARAEAQKARAPLIPLKVRIIPVNFARSADVSARVKDVLTERGTVTTDDRTNVLIVKDIPEALARAEGLVRNLDTEIPQVRIESRIVEASANFNRAIGVQWGGNATASAATGNPTGLYFPNTVVATGAAGNSPSNGAGAMPNYAVNLPAAIGQGSGGGIGFQFGSVGGAFNLNLALTALENQGVVKTVSAPSVSTVDNKEATIGQGISIPFSQVSASGVNTVFIEAKLELKVTPHVSADGSVLMKIKVTNNSPNPQLTGANGQPSISKREAETESLVKDGETTVIGGIYTRQTSHNTAAVPFLSKLPILGFFFRTDSDTDNHTELLVFITPRILNRQANAALTAAAAGGQP